jgi:hypothetical protein
MHHPIRSQAPSHLRVSSPSSLANIKICIPRDRFQVVVASLRRFVQLYGNFEMRRRLIRFWLFAALLVYSTVPCLFVIAVGQASDQEALVTTAQTSEWHHGFRRDKKLYTRVSDKANGPTGCKLLSTALAQNLMTIE